MVCISSLSVTFWFLLKSFDGFRCYLAGTLVRSNDRLHCVRWGPWSSGKVRFWGRTPSQNMQLQIVVHCQSLTPCCHLVDTNDRFHILSDYFGLVLVRYCIYVRNYRASDWLEKQWRKLPTSWGDFPCTQITESVRYPLISGLFYVLLFLLVPSLAFSCCLSLMIPVYAGSGNECQSSNP